MNSGQDYVVAFLEDALGVPIGSVTKDSIPAPLRSAVLKAVSGDQAASSLEPVVDAMGNDYAKRVEESALEDSGFSARKAKWPGDATFAACLTHDVDTISRTASEVLARRNRFSISDVVQSLIGVKSLYNNIRYVAGMEGSRGMRSSFYFLSSAYDLHAITSEVDELQTGGWEVGLHGDFGTHDSQEAMMAAVGKLKAATGTDPEGVREHYLRFDYGKTWKIIEDAGFSYDTTVGNRDSIGFRIGLSTPFHPPYEDGRPMKLLELPMSLMDTTLWGYLRLDENKGLEESRAVIERVSKVNGLFTLLWHQESARMKGGRIYPKVLDELRRRKAFVGTGSAISQWWRERASPLRATEDGFWVELAPKGLCVNFRAKREGKLAVDGGILTQNGKAGTVTASGGPLRARFL